MAKVFLLGVTSNCDIKSTEYHAGHKYYRISTRINASKLSVTNQIATRRKQKDNIIEFNGLVDADQVTID